MLYYTRELIIFLKTSYSFKRKYLRLSIISVEYPAARCGRETFPRTFNDIMISFVISLVT